MCSHAVHVTAQHLLLLRRVVSHQATLRVLYAYLTDRHPSKCPWLEMPLHTVIQITPKAYGVDEVRHVLYELSDPHH